MKLEQLIEIANKAYDDDLIKSYFKRPDLNHGDGLAQFIANEIRETFEENASDQEQLAEAARVMIAASVDLNHVIAALEERLYVLRRSR